MSDASHDSIFFDEWQACLRAHYQYVIETDDAVTEPTLRGVLLQAGLTLNELATLADSTRTEPRPSADESDPA